MPAIVTSLQSDRILVTLFLHSGSTREDDMRSRIGTSLIASPEMHGLRLEGETASESLGQA